MKRSNAWLGFFCPTGGERHGLLIALSSGGFHCPHAEHCGRPKSHPAGALPQSRAVFTFDEAEGKVAVAGAAS